MGNCRQQLALRQASIALHELQRPCSGKTERGEVIACLCQAHGAGVIPQGCTAVFTEPRKEA